MKPRNIGIAFILSLLATGLGQVYNGELKKGQAIYALYILTLIISSITGLLNHFYGFVFFIGFELSLVLYSTFDAMIQARIQRNYTPKPYNKWYTYLGVIFTNTLLLEGLFLFSVVGVKSFTIPTPSSKPTIQIGDRIIADMNAYRSKNPVYGDLVIYEKGNIYYLFRVVGLPNDTLTITNNIVSVNGKPPHFKVIEAKLSINEEAGAPEGSGFENEMISYDVAELEETLPNGRKYHIYRFPKPYDSTKSNMQNIIVPANHYFLMGDNRDNALDSRYEGAISRDRIKGKALFSYWGKSKNRINIDLTKN